MINETWQTIVEYIKALFDRLVILYNMRPVLYYYVPECPKCGSHMTGRYVRRPITKRDIWYVQSESLKHGELVRMVDKVPIENAYCEECGAQWPAHIYGTFIPAWKAEEEKKKRDTLARYTDYLDANPRKKPFWGKVTGFFN